MIIVKNNVIEKNIGDFCSLQQGLQISKSQRMSEKTDNCYLYITVDYLKRKSNNEYIKNPRSSVMCNENDIIVARTGSVGSVFTGINGVFHNNFFKLLLNENCNNKFMYYYLKRKKIKEEMQRRSNGAVIPDLKHSEFLSMKFPLLRLTDQIKISNYIERINKNLNNIKTLLEKIEIRNQYYADKLLSGEFSLNQKYEITNKKSDLLHVKLSDLFEFRMGETILNKDIIKELNDEYCIPVYSATEKDVVFGYAKLDKIKKTLNKNDIIISARGTIGFPKLIDKEIKTSTQTTIQMISKNLYSSYLVKIYLELKKGYYFASEGAAVPQLTIGSLVDKEIILPKDYFLIESFLKKLDNEKGKVEKLLKLEEKRFEWLSDKLLSGEYIIED